MTFQPSFKTPFLMILGGDVATAIPPIVSYTPALKFDDARNSMYLPVIGV